MSPRRTFTSPGPHCSPPCIEASRYSQIFSRSQLGGFLKRFNTEFGDPVRPSTIIWRKDKPDTYRTISAISGFRDLISMSVIPLSWAKVHQFGHVQGPMYSDTFAVYLWMVDNKGEGLVTQTPSLLGYHEVRRLRRQTMPALATHQLDRRDVDIALHL